MRSRSHCRTLSTARCIDATSGGSTARSVFSRDSRTSERRSWSLSGAVAGRAPPSCRRAKIHGMTRAGGVCTWCRIDQGAVAADESVVKVSLWADQSGNGAKPIQPHIGDSALHERDDGGHDFSEYRVFFAKKSGFYFALEMDLATMNWIRPTAMGWFVASRTPRTFSMRTWFFFESGLESVQSISGSGQIEFW